MTEGSETDPHVLIEKLEERINAMERVEETKFDFGPMHGVEEKIVAKAKHDREIAKFTLEQRIERVEKHIGTLYDLQSGDDLRRRAIYKWIMAFPGVCKEFGFDADPD